MLSHKLFLVGTVLLISGTALGQVDLRIACGAVGNELEFCRSAAETWAENTGNKVTVVTTPNSSTERLALYQQQLAAGSTGIDVYVIDVVWPGVLAGFLLDLTPYVDPKITGAHLPQIIENNTVDGKLVALPFYTDVGILYYRSDLLEKYGYSDPPATWEELTQMAGKIQAGERQSNSQFWGLVFQGAAYEGLTCDALEWIDAYGGGTIVDSEGQITINNPAVIRGITQAAGWIGEIAPRGVMSYTEEEARGVFQAGNAAFMRNWPYAYALAQGEDSPIKGAVAVAPLPKGDVPEGKPTGTLGGWQLAVSKFSAHPEEAADLAIYMTGREEQKRRAVEASFLPTYPELYQDPEILAANPMMGMVYEPLTNAVARPSRVVKGKYNQVSSAFWTAVHQVLSGQAKPEAAFQSLEAQLKRTGGRGW